MKNYQPFKTEIGYGWVSSNPKKLQVVLKKAGKKIMELKEKLKFDAVAFSGSSGCAIGFYLAMKYGLPLIYVRKDGESGHTSSKVLCNWKDGHIKKYLIVDDFVSGGITVRHIIRSISNHIEKVEAYPAKPVGVFCYDARQRGRRDTVNTDTLILPKHQLKIFMTDE